MKDSVTTLIYAVVLGTALAVILTGVGRFTGPYKAANEKAEEVRNILTVLNIPFKPDAPAQDLVKIYDDNIRKKEPETGLVLYKYVLDGKTQAVAIPFEGPGLWGPVHGLLSLEPDMKTIRRISFYKHEETPGLGGEISAKWFREQFQGKCIEAPNGKVGIQILKGRKATECDEVDGITGATLTCDKVQSMLNKKIKQIVHEEK